MTPAGNGEKHMTELEIASYLDRGVSPLDRDRIENHLVECVACRENVTEAQQLLRHVRKPRRVFITGAVLAVAAVAVVMIRPQRSNDQLVSRDAAAASRALPVYAPEGQVQPSRAGFIWGADSDAVSYRITVSLPDGSTVWSGNDTDTTVILPDSVRLRSGERYVWVVDAILSDGSTRSTGLKEFRTAR
jgi:Putative zinc-finger